VKMNTLDIIMLVLTACGLIVGFWRGFIAQIVSLAGFFIAYIVAFQFYRDFAPVLQRTFAWPASSSYQKYEFAVKILHVDTYVYNALAFALLFFGVKLSLSVVGRLLHFIAKAPGLNFVNRWSGALLGVAEALLIMIISVNVMTIMPSDGVQKLLSGSTLAPYVIDHLPSFAGRLHELWKQGIPL
jgi:uncharacterized membrane protein required for colicin V production